MKIYISGAMTGIPENNYPAFHKAKEFLNSIGYNAVSPADAPRFNSWEEFMRYDIKLLCDCEGIAMLPGWELSKGANIEKFVADALGLKVVKL